MNRVDSLKRGCGLLADRPVPPKLTAVTEILSRIPERGVLRKGKP
jgi:hypothetical protein